MYDIKFYVLAISFIFILKLITDSISILAHIKVNGDKFSLFKKSIKNSFLFSVIISTLYSLNVWLTNITIINDKFSIKINDMISYLYVGTVTILLLLFFIRIYIKINGSSLKIGNRVKLVLALFKIKIDKEDTNTINDIFKVKNHQKITNPKKFKKGEIDEEDYFNW